MNLYIATRWGNPYEADGPDGKDTNFIVRATSKEDAAKLAEDILQHYPTSQEGCRPVEDFIHSIQRIGEDTSSEIASVIHGPWIEYILTRDITYDDWHRDEKGGEWINISKETNQEAEQSR